MVLGKSGTTVGEKAVDVAIVGGGLAGLTAARRLTQAGLDDVVVIEARDRSGGRVGGEATAGGRQIERGGEFVGAHMSAILGLADELGIPLVDVAAGWMNGAVSSGERAAQEVLAQMRPTMPVATGAPTSG
jgi:monoamine oxidase